MAEDEIETAVIDLGSGYTKLGYAGSEKPSSMFPTITGKPQSSSFNIGQVEETFIGAKAVTHYNSLFVNRPVDRSVLLSKSDGELLLEHSYNILGLDSSKCPLMISEPPLMSVGLRDKLTEIAFEYLDCPSFFVFNQSATSLYSVGRTTGYVVNCGDGTTTGLPINDGFCCSHALYNKDSAGIDLTRDLESIIMGPKAGKLGAPPTQPNFYTFEQMKEKVCFVSLNPITEKSKKQSFKLPDGKSVEIEKAAFEICERIFNPKFLASKKKVASQFVKKTPLAESVCESIATSEELYGVRQTFFENILLTGGTAKLKGFAARFDQDIQEFSPSEINPKVIKDEKVDKLHNAWVGGSIMALLPNTKKQFITKQDYDEEGPDATNKISMFGS